MKKLLEIENVLIQENNFILLDHVSLNFYENINTFICGTSASGKTLLLKAITSQIKYEGKIIKNCELEVVFDKNIFFTNSIEDELKYLMLDDIQKKFIAEFIPEEYLKKDPNKLDFQMKKIVLLCGALVKKPKLIIIDNILSYLEKESIQKLLEYAKENQITIINISNDIEGSLDYDYMVVMDQGKVAVEGKTLQVLEEEKLLKRLGIGLPFYIDLSIQLKLYGLIDKTYLSKEELVKKLWN